MYSRKRFGHEGFIPLQLLKRELLDQWMRWMNVEEQCVAVGGHDG